MRVVAKETVAIKRIGYGLIVYVDREGGDAVRAAIRILFSGMSNAEVTC